MRLHDSRGWKLSILLAFSAATSAYAAPGAALPQATSGSPRGQTFLLSAEDRKHQVITVAAAPANGQTRIIYLNKDGGTYVREQPAFNDARTNRTIIAQNTNTIPPWDVTPEKWQQVVSCIQDEFARWNVEVTDVDPGNVPHLESVIAGYPSDLNPALVTTEGIAAGISPYDSDNCGIIENSIVFTFPEAFGPAVSAEKICEVAAQEIAHSYGLDHQFLCEDPMSYLEGCGHKTFQDQTVSCGTYQVEECFCNMPAQNSVQMLTLRLGLKGSNQQPAPMLNILSPANGAQLSPDFTVSVDLQGTIDRVVVSVDEQEAAVSTTAPYTVQLTQLEVGHHELVVRAEGPGGASSQTLGIEVLAADVGPDTNGDGAGGDSTSPAPTDKPLSEPEAPNPIGCNSSGQLPSSMLLIFAAVALLRLGQRKIRDIA